MRRGTSWVGLNPDERAISLNKQYEAELQVAQHDLASAIAVLDKLQKKLDDLTEISLKSATLEDVNIAAEKKMLINVIVLAKRRIIYTKEILDDAEMKLAIVRREVPLEVEFFGPGLTY